MTDRFLEGRTAWVTDGVTALGRAIVLALADAGACVAFGSVSIPAGIEAPPQDPLEEVEQAVRSCSGVCYASGLDLRDNADIERFHNAAVRTLGPVDVLVNCALISAEQSMLDHRNEVWNAVLDINLHGAYRTTKRCMRGMIERRFGRIMNIAPPAAEVGHARHGAHSASTSALLGLTRCAALEGAEHGVTCNTIYSPLPHRSIKAGGQEEMQPAERAQNRLVPPAEVAGFVVFLCREEALGLTGEAVSVTGGSVHVTESVGGVL